MDDLCTHGRDLSPRLYRWRRGQCNFHNGQFNIKTGEVVSPPCMIPMKIYKTVVENGRVVIEAD
jgi:nitrite reductase/ring-hydroxylating ferredoxin subunit